MYVFLPPFLMYLSSKYLVVACKMNVILYVVT